MSHLWLVLRAEIKRHWIIQWRYAGDSLSWLLFTCLMFVAVVAVLNGVSGDAYGREEQLLVLVGWLAFQVASGVMMRLPQVVSDEAQTGTLEQVCLSPLPLTAILVACQRAVWRLTRPHTTCITKV
jgi:ABC-type transport system involved in cytochrome c biogenesis permease component